MKPFVFLLASSILGAVEIPAGANLEIRLTAPVSTATSHAKDPVSAILIAPVLLPGGSAVVAGAVVEGTVLAATPASEEKNAALKLGFTQLHFKQAELKPSAQANRTYRISTRVYSVDNVRETVDESGSVQGISVKDTITGRIDQGLGKMSNGRLSGLAKILETAKGALVSNADPNISYEAGTEMTLRLAKPLTFPDTLLAQPTPPVTDDGHLSDLVNNQAWQTFAEHPRRASDITNLMFIGEIEQIAASLRAAGWVGSQALSGESKFETALAIIEQRGYKEAPVSVLLLNNRAPDAVMQKANNTFSARHHLRIWRSPDTYAGQTVWLCSATHDIGIDYSDQDRTFIHKIDSNIDLERQKVVNDLEFTGKARGFTVIPRPALPTNFRNATGDDVDTDARMAVLQF